MLIISIIGLALGWHMSIMIFDHIILPRRKKPSTEKILKSIEMDLLQNLRRRLEKLPSEKLKKSPYQDWSTKSEIWFNKLDESHK